MKRKHALILLPVLILALALTGCGKDPEILDSQPETRATLARPLPTAPETTEPEPTVLELPTIPEHTHSFSVAQKTERNCLEDGFTLYTCSCGVGYIEDIVDALDHDIILVAGPSGDPHMKYHYYECTRCDYEFRALGPNNRGPHVCRYVVKYFQPTCAREGYVLYSCLSCGAGYMGYTVPPLEHYIVDEVVPPTETQMGYTSHTCLICGVSRWDNYTDRIRPTATGEE